MPLEAKRMVLFEKSIEALGEEAAMTLMASLPPVPWSELATKEDLRLLEARLVLLISGVDVKVDRLEVKLDALAVRVDGLATRVEALETRVEALETRVDALVVKVDDVVVRVGALEVKVDALEVKVDGIKTEVVNEVKSLLAQQTRTIAVMLVGFAITVLVPLLVMVGIN